MPYEVHQSITTPPSEAIIWKYMDFTKFMSLLDTESLFFSRLDILQKEDPYEGSFTRQNFKLLNAKWEDLSEKERNNHKNKKSFEKYIHAHKWIFERIPILQPQATFVSCWHISEHESHAMWKIYASFGYGIAIKTSISNLIVSLKEYRDFNVFIGQIEYKDYENDFIGVDNLFNPIFCKRRSFEHEKEVRAIIWTPDSGKNDILSSGVNSFEDVYGIKVPIILNQLVEAIYISPNSPFWIKEMIKSILNKYGFNIPVRQPDMMENPIIPGLVNQLITNNPFQGV